MTLFLSKEWQTALQEYLSSVQKETAFFQEKTSVVQQLVTNIPTKIFETLVNDFPGQLHTNEISYFVTYDENEVTVTPGIAENPTVAFSQTWKTAKSVATGEISTQHACMSGDIRIKGDVQTLLGLKIPDGSSLERENNLKDTVFELV